MTIGIYFNEKQAELKTARELADRAERAGAEAVLFSDLSAMPDVDRLVVLGGDGTMLRAAKRAAERSVPLVGVNFGRLGFLTEFERESAEDAIDLVLNGRAYSERSMLDVSLDGVHTVCLNECALLHGVSPEEGPKLTHIRAEIEEYGTGDFHADGLIVSTPTGSTAYSLSAGGAVLTPDCASFLLTPVSAFSMRSRPVVYSDRKKLAVSLPKNVVMYLYGDGEFLGEVRAENTLTVRRAEKSAMFLTREHSDSFGRLTSKLR